MRAEQPVEGVGGGLEVREEGNGVGEGGKFGARDGWEAGVVKGAVVLGGKLVSRCNI